MPDIKLVIFSLCSFALVLAANFLVSHYVNEQKHKNLIFKTVSIVTVIIHYSVLYYEYFTTGNATAGNALLLPIYPCHIAMWLLLILSCMKNKESRAFRIIAEFTFYLGIVGGVIGLLFNEAYISTPDFADWEVLKGLLSHVTMLFTAVYLLFGGYIRINTKNVISVTIGLLAMLADGFLMIGLHRAFGIESPNCMFLLENPFPSITWFNPYLLGAAGVLLVAIITVAVEHFTLLKEERATTKIINKLKKGEAK